MTIVPSRTDFVHAVLRGELRSGSRRPGSPVSVKETAAALRVSHTPVREALERLVGEGVVAPTGSKAGFQVTRLSPFGLAQAVDLHGVLAATGLGRLPRRLSATGWSRDLGAVASIDAVFAQIFTERVNSQIAAAAERISILLAPYRAYEVDLFPDWEAELAALAQRLAGSRSEAGAALRAYHRRRSARAADLISAAG